MMSGSGSSNYHRVALSSEERLKLIQTISELPDGQFEHILFAIRAPTELLPGNASARSNRASELLKWAQGPTGPGLREVLGILKKILDQTSVSTASSIFSKNIFAVPHRKNIFFTGREEIIEQIRNALLVDGITTLLGLGGVGKTQTVVEYAYRYRKDYRSVFWLQADTILSLENDFIELASLLGSPQKEAQEAVLTVKRRLEKTSDWLLIVDGVNDPEKVKSYIPRRGNGHVLLTSRNQDCQAIGGIDYIEIHELSSQEALDFICKRIKRGQLDNSELEAAEELIDSLGYLPLALEQAGAYILTKKVLIRDYIISYKKRKIELLEQAKPATGDYPESIASTWSINFLEIEKTSPTSADLMRVSAFLNSDNIPLYLIRETIEELGDNIREALSDVEDDPVILNEYLEPLNRYSLIQLDPNTYSYSTHRLVQEVLRLELNREDYHLWARRIIFAISRAFPEVEFENWLLCETLLIHAKSAANLIEDLNFDFPEAVNLLKRLGAYLLTRGQYYEAEPILAKVLAVNRNIFGEQHEEVATSNHELGVLYFTQGRYIESELSLIKALSARRNLFKDDSIDIAESLFSLGFLYYLQGRYRESEPLLLQSSEIRKKKLGDEHADVLSCLHELGNLYTFQGRYKEAEALYSSNIHIRERILREDHPDLAESLNNLALLYYYQGRYMEAETLYLRVLRIDRKNSGEEHPDTAISYNNLALLYIAQERYTEAEEFCLKSLKIRQDFLGEQHPHVAQSTNNLAGLYEAQEQYEKAEELYIRALEMERKSLGSNHPDIADSLNDLAGLYRKSGRLNKSQDLYTQALDLAQRSLGNSHRYVAISLHGLGLILEAQEKYVEAETFLAQALEISVEVSGEDHPFTRLCRRDLKNLRRNDYTFQQYKLD